MDALFGLAKASGGECEAECCECCGCCPPARFLTLHHQGLSVGSLLLYPSGTLPSPAYAQATDSGLASAPLTGLSGVLPIFLRQLLWRGYLYCT